VAERRWQPCPVSADDADAFSGALKGVYTDLYTEYFADEPFVNHSLPIQVRSFRNTEGWAVCLLLTPWMLSRVFATDAEPGIRLPTGWSVEERRGESPSVLGPMTTFSLLGAEQKAHLNYHPRLGHYLIHPLIQSMGEFDSADSAFTAWRGVIERRDRFAREQNKNCGWQAEVSRREFFTKLSGR
jgi:hypothetical protein